MEAKQFQRRIEDFTCENCGAQVQGDGYRNHCPKCLVSKHVDIHPGDRAADCGGLMDVTDIERKKGEWVLVQTCRLCGFVRRNKIQDDDDQSVLHKMMSKKQF